MNRLPVPGDWSRILLESAVILVLGVLLGLTINYKVVMNVLSGHIVRPPVVQEEVGDVLPVPVALQDVRDMAQQGALLVDARSLEDYGQGHLPTAVSLPLEDVEQRLPGFKGEVAVERPLIVYCNGYACPDSFDLAILLLKEGFADVSVFEGGYPEWQDAGLPIEGGQR